MKAGWQTAGRQARTHSRTRTGRRTAAFEFIELSCQHQKYRGEEVQREGGGGRGASFRRLGGKGGRRGR